MLTAQRQSVPRPASGRLSGGSGSLVAFAVLDFAGAAAAAAPAAAGLLPALVPALIVAAFLPLTADAVLVWRLARGLLVDAAVLPLGLRWRKRIRWY